MIGSIVGDIAGSNFEFDNTLDYNFNMFGPDSDFTDDTICTIAVADAILNDIDYQTSLRKWCRKYPHPKGEYGSYFFNWVMRPDPYPYNSFGNGSAMRVSPVAWLFDSEEKVRNEAEKSAIITHNHPEGIKGAIAISVAIFRMRKARIKTPEIFENVAKEFYGDLIFSNLPPKGFFDVTCQGCVPLALYIASLAHDFEDAIRLAVSYGGDSDTGGEIVWSLSEEHFQITDEMNRVALNRLPIEMQKIYEQFKEQV